MQYRRLGSSDLVVSRVALGTGTFWGGVDERRAHAILTAAFELGCTFFDSADSYGDPRQPDTAGNAEKILGRWLETIPRDQVVLATKVGDKTPANPEGGLRRAAIMKSAEESLRRLNVDCIDVYFAHRPDQSIGWDEPLDAFDALKRQGKIRYAGLSNVTERNLVHAQSALALYHASPQLLIGIQNSYHLLDRQSLDVGLMRRCIEDGLAVVPYGVLAGGFLTGKYRRQQPMPIACRGQSHRGIQGLVNGPASAIIEQLQQVAAALQATVTQVSAAWVLANESVSSVLVGATNDRQIAETLRAADLTLDSEALRRIDVITRPFIAPATQQRG